MRRFLIVAVAAIAIFVGAGALFFHFDPLCGEEMATEQTAPDGRYAAAWMIRNCGATTSYVNHVNLRLADSAFHADFFNGTITDGEILSGGKYTGRIRFCWAGARRLNIEYPEPERESLKQRAWRDVEITYGNACP